MAKIQLKAPGALPDCEYCSSCPSISEVQARGDPANAALSPSEIIIVSLPMIQREQKQPLLIPPWALHTARAGNSHCGKRLLDLWVGVGFIIPHPPLWDEPPELPRAALPPTQAMEGPSKIRLSHSCSQQGHSQLPQAAQSPVPSTLSVPGGVLGNPRSPDWFGLGAPGGSCQAEL